MVWVFKSSGTELLTGDLLDIQDHLKDGETCHGIIHLYERDYFIKKWKIFGKNPKRYLLRSAVVKGLTSVRIKRAKYLLLDPRGMIIAYWRTLPSVKLKELVDA